MNALDMLGAEALRDALARIGHGIEAKIAVISGLLKAARDGALLCAQWTDGVNGCVVLKAATIVSDTVPGEYLPLALVDSGMYMQAEMARILRCEEADIKTMYCAWDNMSDEARRYLFALLRQQRQALRAELARLRFADALDRPRASDDQLAEMIALGSGRMFGTATVPATAAKEVIH